MTRFSIFSFILAVISCGNPKEKAANAELPVDFQVFYELFHRDSSYQMEHITFPLAGLPDYATPEQIQPGGFVWEEAEWTMHKGKVPENSDFRKEIVILSDQMIRERLIHQSRPLMTERRFAKMGDEWFLIYYAGINPYSGGKEEPQK